ncbi:DUF262 domain-containing protein [Anaerocolumna xylanovorans]|uniref:GmrSD restriction endonucleases N-terminal domain-containing protein n=1 Tax=Anaerocolumna xylanovorans DSM 12503 TaxID=1121345 RepID=A0A1M7Y840_9FIRM|nr:DUF262 domain-containing protein [Anaerocolumna xylanovorans]SHO48698.1 Protein of unknown function DUF262 [Anaerocolumna xylanovorans DSM 12503]
MYEIRPESIKTFITDRNVKLPRFQRKQTWEEKKNFQLCISLFKEYPVGVCILSVDESKGKIVRWLLDGRQRKNALVMMYDDPENIYNWAKRFIGFKNSDQPSEIEEKFNFKISEYIEAELDDDFEMTQLDPGEDVSEAVNDEKDDNIDANAYGLELLLEIIKVIHNKQKKNTGFTKPFDFTKYVNRLPYLEVDLTGTKLSSRRVKTFIDEYRKYCDDEYINYDDEKSFYKFLSVRCDIQDEKKTQALVHEKWKEIKERILIVEKIDTLLTNCKIGMIEVKNLSPSDSQKIFNIINSEGEKLTAVEILSAKPHWNIAVDNPSQAAVDATKELYKRIGTVQTNVVRWDLPATFLNRIGKNFILKKFTDTKTDFEKELTYGFKILSSIYVGGVKKEDIEGLSKASNLNWSSDIESLVNDFQNMFKLISSFDYFKYFKSWNTSIMELTSDAIALDFIVIAYKDWCRKGKPLGDSKAKQFQKNCFILWDKLIFEYINKQWRGSSDSKIANNILALDNEPDLFVSVKEDKWRTILEDQIFAYSAIESADISMAIMKPLLYHFYCLKSIQGPDTSYEIEMDHIIPQTLFNESTIERKGVIQDNLLNLGLLPKDENVAKSNKRLILITSQWLKDQIVKYELISETKFHEYSDVNNYQKLFDERATIFIEAYTSKRNNILNN